MCFNLCKLQAGRQTRVETGGGGGGSGSGSGLGLRSGRGRDLSLDPVVEFSSSAQQQVDAGAEGGVRRQEDGGLPALLLRPHPTQQLHEDPHNATL